MTSIDQIQLIFAPGTLPTFARLFSDGAVLSARTGCDLKAYLCGQLGIDPAYLEHRIQTIFLNGKPVDDCETAHVAAGSVVALSAAMPGLAGATLRCGGFFAAMRGAITHQDEAGRNCAAEGTVTLKLFNLLIPEIGPLLLARGIWLGQNGWRQLLADYGDGIQKGCRKVLVNGTAVDPDRLGPQLPQTESVLLKMTEMGAGRHAPQAHKLPDIQD